MATYESGYDSKLGYNKNAFEHPTPVLKVLGKTVRLIAAPIGLVSEAIHSRQEKNQAAERGNDQDIQDSEANEKTAQHPSSLDAAYVNLPPEEADALIASGRAAPAEGHEPTHEFVPADDDEGDDDDDDDENNADEMDWALDDATAELEGEAILPVAPESSPGLLLGLRKASVAEPTKLPFPVIIPQRRPGTKARGFVRAYAPILYDMGIGQQQFMSFLKDFHTHAQASPVFSVIKVATSIAGVYPDPTVTAAVTAVQIAAGFGQEVQERWRTNKFLEQMNQDLFLPRGLYALVVMYKQGASDEPEMEPTTIDIGAVAMAKYGAKETEPDSSDKTHHSLGEDLKYKAKRLRVASGKTQESEMPLTCATLIYPALDALQDIPAGKESETKKGVIDNMKDKSRNTSKFVNDYFDRRAQATYAAANPNSTLSKQSAPLEFKSRYADPKNHTNKHFFTLITGGRFKAEPLGARRRWEKAQRKTAQRRLQGLKEKPQKRFLQESVLYLTIVNKPTEAELEQARQKIKKP